MKVYVVIVILSCAVWSVLGQQDQQFTGACPGNYFTQLIREKEYAGRWYEIKKFNNTLIPGDCGAPNYEHVVGGGFNITFDWKDLVQNEIHSTQVVHKRLAAEPIPGKYDVFVDNQKDRIPELVFETDYKTYSVVFGCFYNPTDGLNTQRVTIYSREKTLNQESLKRALDVLEISGVDSTKLRNVEQDDETCGRK